MDIGAIKRDSSQVEAGEWVSEIPGMDDARLRVRGLQSSVAVTIRSRKERKVGRDGRTRDGNLKPDVAVRIFGEVLHEAVLLDWDGFTDGGKPVPYDAKLAETWLTHPDYRTFADAVAFAAQVVDRGMADEKEELAKNSRKSSAGSSDGAEQQTT